MKKRGGLILALDRHVVKTLPSLGWLIFVACGICMGLLVGGFEVFADRHNRTINKPSMDFKISDVSCRQKIADVSKDRSLRRSTRPSQPNSGLTIVREYKKAVRYFSAEELLSGALSTAVREGLFSADGVYNYLIAPDGRLVVSPHYVVLSKNKLYISDHFSLDRQFKMQSREQLPIGGQIYIFNGQIVQVNQKSPFSLGERAHLVQAVEHLKSWGLEVSETAPRFIESNSTSSTNSFFQGTQDEAIMLYEISRRPELAAAYEKVKALHAELALRMPSAFIPGKVSTEELVDLHPSRSEEGMHWMYFVHSLQDRGLHTYVWERREDISKVDQEMQELRDFVGQP